jgi:hypothetical protein
MQIHGSGSSQQIFPATRLGKQPFPIANEGVEQVEDEGKWRNSSTAGPVEPFLCSRGRV